MKDKRKIAVLIAVGVCVIALIALAGCKDEEAEAATDAGSAKTEVKEEAEQDVLASLSDEEKAEVEKLSAAMEEELSAAASDRERAEIAAKYSKKIEQAAGGKVQMTDGKLTAAASTAQKSDTTAKKTEDKKADTKDKAQTNAAKPSTGGSSGSGTSSVKPSTSSTSTASGSSGSTSGSTAKPAEKQKQKVWVVDQPAWTETFTNYESKEYWWVRYDDGYVYETFNEDDAYNRYGAWDDVHGLGGRWGNGVKSVPYTETIQHKEVGHWEWQ